MQQGKDVVLLELFARMKEIQFDHKTQAGDLRAQGFSELRGCFGRASGGEQVIDNDDALSLLNRVAVDFESVGAIFEGVIVFRGGCRKLARLAHRNKSSVKAVGHCWTENKATGFHAEDEVYVFVQIVFGEGIDKRREEAGSAG